MFNQLGRCTSVFVLGIVGIVQLCQLSQGSRISTQLYPSCNGTDGLPNFSYAKSVSSSASGAWSCLNVNTQTPPGPLTITWFYYDIYPPPDCEASDEVDGDQCCHTTTTSTITFYETVYVNNGAAITVGTSSGNVTAGQFLGKSVTWVATKNVGNINLSCGTAYGKEADVAIVDLIIENGPICLNGMVQVESCPGGRLQL